MCAVAGKLKVEINESMSKCWLATIIRVLVNASWYDLRLSLVPRLPSSFLVLLWFHGVFLLTVGSLGGLLLGALFA